MDNMGAYELARTLVQGEDEQACERCLDQLEAYVEAQLGGRAYTSLFPDVARHLDGCVACAEAYGLLYEALASTAAAEPAHIPEPDLSFLGARESSSPGVALQAAVKDALTQFAAGLQLTLTRALLDLFRPGPGMAEAVRGGDPAALLELTLDDPSPSVAQLQISVYPAVDAPEACDLRAQLRLPGRDWPDLAGVAVIVSAAGLHREATTDAWGEAVIEGLPLSALEGAQIEVRL